jgi:G3E family GTPase
MSPIGLTILTGFLGAGKTTLLNHILNGDHGRKIAVIVNDFGAINIDSQLVVDVGQDDTIELSNGCICCTIRGDLLQALIDLTRRPSPPEYIIIEASGVSDPLEIAMTFRQPQLATTIAIDSVLTVIDAEQIRDLERENEVLAILQVGAADIVILNKVDLVSEADLANVRAWVRSIIPNARIFETRYAQVPLELILDVQLFAPDRVRAVHEIHVHAADEPIDHDHHHDHDHTDHSLVFHTYHWHSDQPLSLRAVQRAIETLPTEIFRAKGFLYLVDDLDHLGILQVVGKRASVTIGRAWGDQAPFSEIVIIGTAGHVDRAALDHTFERCLAVNAPQSELGRITERVFEWLRRIRRD